MILSSFALSLLAIVAGMMLLAQTKRENLGNVYRYVSLFVIIMGVLCLLGALGKGAMKCCKMGHRRMEMREYRMDGGMMMRGHGMMGHRGMMGGCGMMERGCCNDMMGGCNENMGGMNECKEGMNEECNEGKDGGSCPMMMHDEKHEGHEGMEMKKDSVKKK